MCITTLNIRYSSNNMDFVSIIWTVFNTYYLCYTTTLKGNDDSTCRQKGYSSERLPLFMTHTWRENCPVGPGWWYSWIYALNSTIHCFVAEIAFIARDDICSFRAQHLLLRSNVKAEGYATEVKEGTVEVRECDEDPDLRFDLIACSIKFLLSSPILRKEIKE